MWKDKGNGGFDPSIHWDWKPFTKWCKYQKYPNILRYEFTAQVSWSDVILNVDNISTWSIPSNYRFASHYIHQRKLCVSLFRLAYHKLTIIFATHLYNFHFFECNIGKNGIFRFIAMLIAFFCPIEVKCICSAVLNVFTEQCVLAIIPSTCKCLQR